MKEITLTEKETQLLKYLIDKRIRETIKFIECSKEQLKKEYQKDLKLEKVLFNKITI